MPKWVKYTVIAILATLLVAFLSVGKYFYNYAIVPSEKDFLEESSSKKTDEQKVALQWFTNKNHRTNWTLTATDGLTLSAIYLPANNDVHKTAILAHGYMSDAEQMADYAKMYHDLGYNVLVPDARGHGKSEGNYIGFGWPERKDYLQWITQVLQNNGLNEKITLFGVSMGAATMMMVSGEDLPNNVQSIIEDCGYSSAYEELSYQLNKLYQLPPVPILQATSVVAKIRAGYYLGEADAKKQLKNNRTPILFIHGDQDDFVPYTMQKELYSSTNAPKELWTVKGAKHAASFAENPAVYKTKVAEFLEKYE